jgi:hypothetical protein
LRATGLLRAGAEYYNMESLLAVGGAHPGRVITSSLHEKKEKYACLISVNWH